ncbi:Uncharacterized conserved protein, contains NRDE domain [Halopseudomonas xinjiangensis]|uniref:Uncharacterized conserved protein, contains NRDE domain n=1 Tax=Halopseudomonas xinjiangensis TaxID=487184 RepID=A0A1H1LBY5_9GAMM|nr:NRDE family protein [Halopseudomonas xinjiangensis]SDR72016.1 Uncharacterized conserved protein, contains NRDE domain [Halopseudomonas xinjiangensis]
MCLIALAWQVSEQPLVLLGNRDEFHARPTREAQFWADEGWPDLLAGKDLEAGGSWLGVTRSGRFAALTNIRTPGAPVGLRSRGELVAGFLTSTLSPRHYLDGIEAHCKEFGGFNLLVGDIEQLCYLNSHEALPRELRPGYYGLSNAALDAPWPKLTALRTGLQRATLTETEALMALLADPRQYPDEQLPKTGVSLDWERALSAAFIVGEAYGTRASSVLRITADERVELVERRFGPGAVELGESRYEFALEADQRA